MNNQIIKTPDNDTLRDWLKALNLLEQDAITTHSYQAYNDSLLRRDDEAKFGDEAIMDDLDYDEPPSDYLFLIGAAKAAIEALIVND